MAKRKKVSYMASAIVDRIRFFKMRRTPRTQAEVLLLVRQVAIMRHHGLKWISIARVLDIDQGWLSRLKDKYGIA